MRTNFMSTNPAALKAEVDYNREVIRERGLKFDTAPEPEAPWKRELQKLADVLRDDLRDDQKTASAIILPTE